MNVGVSTANLYPMYTEEALEQLLKAGFQYIEIFINTESEAEPEFAGELRRRADVYGARILSVHSYNAISEAFLYFSNYQRRFEDGVKHLKKLFETACILGASYVIIHGDRPYSPLSDEDSIRRFERLYDLGKKYGIILLQENVFNYRSGNLAYLSNMRRLLGEKAQFVLDLKQCKRCGIHPSDVISAMAGGIRHVHVSDSDDLHDCLVPGRGKTDYGELLSQLKKNGFEGDLIMELYRNNFNDITDLDQGCKILKKMITL